MGQAASSELAAVAPNGTEADGAAWSKEVMDEYKGLSGRPGNMPIPPRMALNQASSAAPPDVRAGRKRSFGDDVPDGDLGSRHEAAEPSDGSAPKKCNSLDRKESTESSASSTSGGSNTAAVDQHAAEHAASATSNSSSLSMLPPSLRPAIPLAALEAAERTTGGPVRLVSGANNSEESPRSGVSPSVARSAGSGFGQEIGRLEQALASLYESMDTTSLQLKAALHPQSSESNAGDRDTSLPVSPRQAEEAAARSRLANGAEDASGSLAGAPEAAEGGGGGGGRRRRGDEGGGDGGEGGGSASDPAAPLGAPSNAPSYAPSPAVSSSSSGAYGGGGGGGGGYYPPPPQHYDPSQHPPGYEGSQHPLPPPPGGYYGYEDPYYAYRSAAPGPEDGYPEGYPPPPPNGYYPPATSASNGAAHPYYHDGYYPHPPSCSSSYDGYAAYDPNYPHHPPPPPHGYYHHPHPPPHPHAPQAAAPSASHHYYGEANGGTIVVHGGAPALQAPPPQ